MRAVPAVAELWGFAQDKEASMPSPLPVVDQVTPEIAMRIAESDARIDAFNRDLTQRIADDPTSLSEWFLKRARANPEAVAAIEQDRRWTYRDLEARAAAARAAALSTGLAQGDVVAIMAHNSVDLYALFLGLSTLGISFSLLNPDMRGRPLEHALANVPVKLVVATGQETSEIRSHHADLTCISIQPSGEETGLSLEQWILPHRQENRLPDNSPMLAAADTLFYIFTSGTTGLPKAARVSHARYIAGSIFETAILDLTKADRIYVVLPMFHIAALTAMGAAIAAGGSFLLRRRFSASQFWRDIREYEATAVQYLGEIARYVAERPPQADDRNHTLRAMVGAGIQAPVWRTFVERFGVREVRECYGSTEGVCNFHNLDGVIGSVGRAHSSDDSKRLIKIDPETLDCARDAKGALIECLPGEPGELIGALPDASKFEGYTSAQATESRYVRDPGHKIPLWFRTGDLFRSDAAGYHYFIDRLGDSYRWKGENVSTQEVAAAILDVDDIRNAVVYGVRVPGAEGRAGMVLVSPRRPPDFDVPAFSAHLSKVLTRAAMPLFLRIGVAEEVTSTYKLRKADLQAQGYGPGAGSDPLFLWDAAQQVYVPLDAASLARHGIPEFEPDVD